MGRKHWQYPLAKPSRQRAVEDLARHHTDQAPGVLSADGTTAIVTANISGDNDEATTKATAIKALVQEFKSAYPSLTIYAFNNRLINEEFGNYVNNSLDSLLLPTSGSVQRLTGEVGLPGSDIEYYKLSYLAGHYWPLSETFTFKAKAELGYGNGYGSSGTLPFYKNFFAGGSSTVRGYKSNSLGPRDTLPPNDPIGGTRRVLGNMELLFPIPGMASDNKSMRLSVFTDAGMVYGADQKVDLSQLRYSAGLAFNWYSPVGPLSFSYAVPLHSKPGDQKESFQFTLGVPLR